MKLETLCEKFDVEICQKPSDKLAAGEIQQKPSVKSGLSAIAQTPSGQLAAREIFQSSIEKLSPPSSKEKLAIPQTASGESGIPVSSANGARHSSLGQRPWNTSPKSVEALKGLTNA